MISTKLITDTLWVLDDVTGCPFQLKEKISEFLEDTHGDSILSLDITDNNILRLGVNVDGVTTEYQISESYITETKVFPINRKSRAYLDNLTNVIQNGGKQEEIVKAFKDRIYRLENAIRNRIPLNEINSMKESLVRDIVDFKNKEKRKILMEALQLANIPISKETLETFKELVRTGSHSDITIDEIEYND